MVGQARMKMQRGRKVARHRYNELADDLKDAPFNLSYQQRTIMNHYFRTPVTIIKGLLENSKAHYGGFGEYTITINKIDYDTIIRELEEIVRAVAYINAS